MTVVNTINRVLYACDGVQTAFPFLFKIYAASDLEVVLRTVATGAETTLTLTTHYTVAITDPDVGEGGTVTLAGTYLTTPPSSAYKLLIRRVLAYTQAVPFNDGDRAPASRQSEVADRGVMLAQQVAELLGRQIALKASSAYAGLSMDDPVAGYLQRWKADLSGMENVAAVDAGVTPVSVLMAEAISKNLIADVLSAMGLDVDLATLSLPASTTISAYVKSFLDDATAAAARTTLLMNEKRIGDYADLAAAVTAIGSTACTLIIDSNQSVAADLTIPATLKLKVDKGAIITVATGQTLTINGPFEAGLYQVFSLTGTGAVAFGKLVHSVYPEWWGATASTYSDTTYEAGNVAAFNAALSCGCKNVKVSQGVFRFNSGLTMGDYVTMEGNAYAFSNTESFNSARLHFNMASGVAITVGVAPVLERLTFVNCEATATFNDATHAYGANTAVCLGSVNNATIRDCTFILWKACIKLGSSCYYLRTFDVDFNRCDSGYITDGTNAPYNVELNTPRSTYVNIFFNGNGVFVTNLKIIGGCIEDYDYVVSQYVNVSVYGTYFETSSPGGAAIPFDPGGNDCSTSIYGILMYLNSTNRVVNGSGRTNCSITMSGNRFRAYDASAAGATVLVLPTSGEITCVGDAFDSNVRNDVTYVGVAGLVHGIILYPIMPAGNTHAGASGKVFVGKLSGISSIANASAPSTTGLAGGTMFLADGSGWDPLSRSAGRPYWVVWQGDRWMGVSGA